MESSILLSTNSVSLTEYAVDHSRGSTSVQSRSSVSTTDEENQIQRQSCRLRYRLRWFNSKAAFLVLVWMVLLNFVIGALEDTYTAAQSYQSTSNDFDFLASLIVNYAPHISFIIAPIVGLLADQYFGVYKITRCVFYLTLIVAILNCILCQITDYFIDFESIWYLVLSVVLSMAYCACRAVIWVNLLTLGINQMPDASTENITSYIIWFACALNVGYWISDFSQWIATGCAQTQTMDNVRVWSLLPVIGTAIVCISDSILSQQWLIIEPESMESPLKVIYQVLRFAAKHKSPLNRSALTYWEEEIPSRIDLGKSRYGGPFTTEDVENVKVVFRFLVLSIPIFLIYTAQYMVEDSPIVPQLVYCEMIDIFQKLVAGDNNTIVYLIIIYELAIYPIISHRLPSIFVRYGIGAILVLAMNTVHLFIAIILLAVSNPDANLNWLVFIHPYFYAVVQVSLLTSLLELVYAQAPYKMRGLFLGFCWCLILTAFIFADIASGCLFITSDYASVIFESVATVLSVIGFIIYCVLARWYKRRVREIIDDPHKWAEEAYDTYLTKQQALGRPVTRQGPRVNPILY